MLYSMYRSYVFKLCAAYTNAAVYQYTPITYNKPRGLFKRTQGKSAMEM